jgi:predicted metal-binding membrane protein
LDNSHANPLPLQRDLILGLLLALAAIAWAVLIWQSADADMDMTMAASTMGMRAPVSFGVLGDHDGGNDVPDCLTHDPHLS